MLTINVYFYGQVKISDGLVLCCAHRNIECRYIKWKVVSYYIVDAFSCLFSRRSKDSTRSLVNSLLIKFLQLSIPLTNNVLFFCFCFFNLL